MDQSDYKHKYGVNFYKDYLYQIVFTYRQVSSYARPLFEVLSYGTLMTQLPQQDLLPMHSHDLLLLNICTTLMFLFSALHSYLLL